MYLYSLQDNLINLRLPSYKSWNSLVVNKQSNQQLMRCAIQWYSFNQEWATGTWLIFKLTSNNYSHAVKIKHRQFNRSNRNWIMSSESKREKQSKGELWDYCHFGESFSHWIFYFQTCTADPSSLLNWGMHITGREVSLSNRVTRYHPISSRAKLSTVARHTETRLTDWMAIHSRKGTINHHTS